jgi:BirA family biotin operon repressor/biotin-[acetyl-CoA-carboxylase] ligase
MSDAPPPRPPLDTTSLHGLTGGRISFDVEVVADAPSTNALAAARAQAGAAEGLVITAEHQTAGRGRLDRTWETPDRAALTLSVVLRPEVEPALWPWLPLLVGVSVARSLRAVGAAAELKWPNDVPLDGRKVCGILVERVESTDGPAAVAGIGINVSTTAEELPIEAATSLSLAGHDVDRTALLARLLRTLGETYTGWLADPAALRAGYADLCATVPGRRVRVELPDGTSVTGTTRDIAESGGLVVASERGDMTVNAGDVVHLRAAEE